MRRLLATTAIVCGALWFHPQAAHAGQIIYMNGYSLPDPGQYSGAVTTIKPDGNSYSTYTGPITLHFSDHADILVYCADLAHVLHDGYYEISELMTNGLGEGISTDLSHRLGVLATLGFAALGTSNYNLATAVQAAIWDTEYDNTGHPNVVSTTGNGTIASEIAAYLSEGVPLGASSRAVALIPYGQGWSGVAGASQQMIVGLAADVPEPASIALLGFGLLGTAAVARRRRA